MLRSLGNRNKKVFLNKFPSFLFFYDQRKPKGKPKMWLNKLVLFMDRARVHQTMWPIKDRSSITIIIRAIKSKSRSFDKPEKPQVFYDPFVMHFHSNETNSARKLNSAISFLSNNDFGFQISLNQQPNEPWNFEFYSNYFSSLNVRWGERNSDHVARLFMTWSCPIINASHRILLFNSIFEERTQKKFSIEVEHKKVNWNGFCRFFIDVSSLHPSANKTGDFVLKHELLLILN